MKRLMRMAEKLDRLVRRVCRATACDVRWLDERESVPPVAGVVAFSKDSTNGATP